MNNLTTPKIKKVKKRRSVEEWRALVAGFAESDLSLAKYCKTHSVALSGFYGWRKRFENEAAEPSAFIEMLAPEAPEDSDARVNSSSLPTLGWRVELSLGNGMILRVR